MFSADTDSKEFLQVFVNNYIKKIMLLQKIFKKNICNIIITYIATSREYTIEKYNICNEFLDDYNNRLNISFSINYSYYYLNKIINSIELYFGGKEKYNELNNIYWRDIHRPHIIQGFIELNKTYPKNFLNTYPNILSLYNKRFCCTFNFPSVTYPSTYYIEYSLHYINYNLWTLKAERSQPINIEHKAGKILCDKVSIQEIIIYFQSIS